MGHYKSNVRDLEFNLFEVFNVQDHLGKGPFEQSDEDTARSVLAEVKNLAEGVLGDSFVDADRNPPVFDPATHSATLPESLKKSYQACGTASGTACSCRTSWAASAPRRR